MKDRSFRLPLMLAPLAANVDVCARSSVAEDGEARRWQSGLFGDER
ncbi:hypothetical protein Pla163_19370 [Planctomycetes bacterium Pla163]|uniref:Uncharacterized protein n=1 Tax=Rohdeia mirabilis TaxID=2528008 RepID=A0A518D016_9BACT|nr:hypothetical protein Pla163_19370 [Planctomycetes bacterium Pla163]